MNTMVMIPMIAGPFTNNLAKLWTFLDDRKSIRRKRWVINCLVYIWREKEKEKEKRERKDNSLTTFSFRFFTSRSSPYHRWDARPRNPVTMNKWWNLKQTRVVADIVTGG